MVSRRHASNWQSHDKMRAAMSDAPQEPINTPTYLRLRTQIRDDIVAGIWPLGSRVTLAELGAHYQVSNVPVREALLQLQGEGVVDMRMNRGALIPNVDAKFIDDSYHLRGALQSMLARLACQRGTEDAMKQLRELAERHEAAAASGDVALAVAANRNLHQHLDQMADNAQARQVLQQRSSLIDAFRRLHGYGPGRLTKVVAQHRRIVRAVLHRDADAASQAVLLHVDEARRDLLSLL
jgi:DNA-binding GntR family transcriptional regulator